MRKYKINVHYDVAVPVEVEAVNSTDALCKAEKIASKMDLSDSIRDNVDSYIDDVDETDFDESEIVDELVDKAKEINSEIPDEYFKQAVEDLLKDMNYFDSLTIDELMHDVISLGEKFQEEDEKLYERCRGENF